MAEQIKVAPPVFSDKGQRFEARTVCRSHAEEHRMENLLPYISAHTCAVKGCENPCSYLTITHPTN